MKNLSLITLLALFALASSCTLKEAINPDGSLKKRDTTGILLVVAAAVAVAPQPLRYQPAIRPSLGLAPISL